MYGHPKLFAVKWLGFSVTVRVRDKEWIFHSFIIIFFLPLSKPETNTEPSVTVK